MKHLKQLLIYLIWTILALLLGIMYMRFVLGANDVPKEGGGYLFYLFYNWGLVNVGLIVGLVIAVLFILFYVFYLKEKLNKYKHRWAIRFVLLLAISIIVAIIHYVLEKVIDVI